MPTSTMPYRRLGRSGLQVSVLSFGSWVSFGNQLDTGLARDCLAAAWDAGVNFFDNAESYAAGESERIMGAAIAELAWPREKFVVSSKFYWGLSDGPNTRNTLNRKYLLQAVDGSLERFGLDFVDLLYCHRPDPTTPPEETVCAISVLLFRCNRLSLCTSQWNVG
jgi:aryl-alcohol dehydrogenase-like predicted oxidoreductase